MSDDAGSEACLANMRAQMVMGYQGLDQAETGGPAAASDAAAASFCSRSAAAERRLTCIHILIHTYIHFYHIYICYKYLRTAHMVKR